MLAIRWILTPTCHCRKPFDLLIKYGDVDTYDIFLLGYQKPTSLFFTLPTGSTTGQHGLLGGEAINGYYATFCALKGVALQMGMISSTSQRLRNTHQVSLVVFIPTTVVRMLLGMIVRMVTIYSKCDILYVIDLWSL